MTVTKQFLDFISLAKSIFFYFLCSKKSAKAEKPKGKQKRVWDQGGNANDAATLDFSKNDQSTPTANGDASLEDISEEQVGC